MEATTKDLRLHAGELIAATDRGEEVVITYHGRARAVLGPIADRESGRPERNPAFGLWRTDGDPDTAGIGEESAEESAAKSVEDQVRRLRERRQLP